jgi:hypothetical protein
MLSRLYTLLLVVVVLSTIAFVVALVSDVYGPLAVGIVALWSPVWIGGFWLITALRRKRLSECMSGLFLWFVVVSGVCYVMTIGCSDPSQVWWGMSCSNRLRQIGMALHSYHRKYDCFPPAYLADEKGKPVHSWRTLILPFLEHQDLYSQYDFNEPWDGPKNKLLLNKEPLEYVCPADEHAIRSQGRPTECTSYVAIVGPQAAWNGSKPVKFGDLRDGTSNTILVIDVANSGVGWSEPRDLPWDEIRNTLVASSGITISPKHWMPQGFFWKDSPGYHIQALFADGSTRYIPAWNLTPALLEATFTVGSGGYDEHNFKNGSPPGPALNWWNCTVFVIWTGSVYLLLRQRSLALQAGKPGKRWPIPALENRHRREV